jgi:hypothetical protein
MKTEKDLLMYFSTALRNIGLFTSISFAALGYSRYHRSKNAIYNIYLILASLFFIFTSIYLAYYLIQDIEMFQTDKTRNTMDKWIIIPKALIVMNSGVFILGAYTLFREVR